MKEQDIVDDNFVNNVQAALICNAKSWHMIDPVDICEAVISEFLHNTETGKRLKQLEKSIKQEIRKTKRAKAELDPQNEIWRHYYNGQLTVLTRLAGLTK
jgi:diphthamide biosynthesis methyltransferase